MKSLAILTLALFIALPARSKDVTTPADPVELFNGRDFSGFTFCMKSNSAPALTWSVANGVIHCTGKPVGYIRTEKSFHDYKLTVEWRFVRIAPKDDNTGVLLHIQNSDKVWPQCVQVQGKHDRQGDLFLMAGAEAREHKGMDANSAVPMRGLSAEKPIGEWNISETICSSNTVTAYINGRLMNEITECTISSGYIGIQSEGGEIEIRKMTLDPLK